MDSGGRREVLQQTIQCTRAREWLHSLVFTTRGTQYFRKNLLQFLNSVLHEIRSHGRVVTPFRNQWPSGTGINLRPLNLWESRRVIEVFLDAFSELAEEAWSPTLEHTWRKALKAILASYLRSAKISNLSRKSELIFIMT